MREDLEHSPEEALLGERFEYAEWGQGNERATYQTRYWRQSCQGQRATRVERMFALA